MPDYEHVLSFRPLEPQPARSAAGAMSGNASSGVAANEPFRPRGEAADTCAVPWVKPAEPEPFTWRDLRSEQPTSHVQIRLGRSIRSHHEACALGTGAIVTLDRSTDEPVEVVVDGRVVAFGRLVVTSNNKLAIEISQVRRVARSGAA